MLLFFEAVDGNPNAFGASHLVFLAIFIQNFQSFSIKTNGNLHGLWIVCWPTHFGGCQNSTSFRMSKAYTNEVQKSTPFSEFSWMGLPLFPGGEGIAGLPKGHRLFS